LMFALLSWICSAAMVRLHALGETRPAFVNESLTLLPWVRYIIWKLRPVRLQLSGFGHHHARQLIGHIDSGERSWREAAASCTLARTPRRGLKKCLNVSWTQPRDSRAWMLWRDPTRERWEMTRWRHSSPTEMKEHRGIPSVLELRMGHYPGPCHRRQLSWPAAPARSRRSRPVDGVANSGSHDFPSGG
jgi:hypothetical protein